MERITREGISLTTLYLRLHNNKWANSDKYLNFREYPPLLIFSFSNTWQQVADKKKEDKFAQGKEVITSWIGLTGFPL